MFDEDPEGMLEEEEHEEAMTASRLLKDLEENESEPSFQDAEVEKITEQCIETPGVSNEGKQKLKNLMFKVRKKGQRCFKSYLCLSFKKRFISFLI